MITIAIGIFLGWLGILAFSFFTQFMVALGVEANNIAARGRAIRLHEEAMRSRADSRVAAYMAENERNHAKRE